MAEELWLLRHGDAEDGAGKPDEERRLTPKGEDQARWAGGALASLDVRFAHVFTSPRVRAHDTARLACEALGAEAMVHQPLSATRRTIPGVGQPRAQNRARTARALNFGAALPAGGDGAGDGEVPAGGGSRPPGPSTTTSPFMPALTWMSQTNA